MNTIDKGFIPECEKAHGDDWRKWLGHLKGKRATGLEIGTWLGESAEWMLHNIFTNDGSRYYCVDTFEGSEEHHLAGIDCSTIEGEARERLSRFGIRAQIFKSESHQAMRYFFREMEFDFIYVDASHDSMNVLRDAVLSFEMLRVGGVMIFDDLTWAVMPDPIDCPRLAIESFVSCYAKRVEVIGMGLQLAIKKVS